MATYTSNYGWTKPSGSDNVDISVLNNNLDNQDSVIHNAFLNMAVPFSELSTYAVDDIVLYDTGLYKCHTAVVTPGSWTGSTNWQVYKLSEGGGGGLTLGETSSTAYRGDRGKTAYDHSQTTGNPHGTTAADVGLGNVPNVSTNDQEPTFTEATTRNNIASGEKLSVIFGKIQKFFNDLKTVAFSGSYTDLSDKPNATQVMLSDGVTSVEEAVDELTDYVVDTTTISGVKITKMGHLVILSIDKTITMNGSQWVLVGTVPYKPTTEIFSVAKQNAVDKSISINLPTNGKLAVMGSGADAILVRGSLTYLTND